MTVSIERALREVRSSGSFHSRDTAPSQCLSLSVEGVGNVRFPVSATTAAKLVKRAKQAPFGHRDETRYDTRVRDTWEIAAAEVRTGGDGWHVTLAEQLDTIRYRLGLAASCQLVATLDKLLVYATGQHFDTHQDSERADNMLGTLSVVLPSQYKGGTLEIEHAGETVACRRSRATGNPLTFVAFYADCRHRVRPVTEGYRVVLAYHLTLAAGGAPMPASSPRRVQQAVLRGVESHFIDVEGSAPEKLVYLLDHEYSERSLSWRHLKGADAARAAALREAAARVDCEVFLALVDVRETWDCDHDNAGWGNRGWGSRYDDYDDYGDDDEDDDDDDDEPYLDDATSYRLTDLIDSDLELRHMVDAADQPSGWLPRRIDRIELCETRPSVELEPFEAEYEGWMGNYGNTVDRWYHRAAVLLWPAENTLTIRAANDAGWLFNELEAMLERGEAGVARDSAKAVVASWTRARRVPVGAESMATAMQVAAAIGDSELAAGLLLPFNLEHLGPSAMPGLAALSAAYGDLWCSDQYAQWKDGPYRGQGVQLEELPRIAKLLATAGASSLAVWVVADQWNDARDRCEAALRDQSSPAARDSLVDIVRHALRIIEAASHLEQEGMVEELLSYLTAQDKLVPADTLAAALRQFDRGRGSRGQRGQAWVVTLQSHTINALERLLAIPPRAADDWSISCRIACDCELCGTLSSFLHDKHDARLEWPIAKDKRQHVHRQIEHYGLPVSHQTRRKGRPFTLMLAKRKNLYKRDAALRKQRQEALAWLIATRDASLRT